MLTVLVTGDQSHKIAHKNLQHSTCNWVIIPLWKYYFAGKKVRKVVSSGMFKSLFLSWCRLQATIGRWMPRCLQPWVLKSRQLQLMLKKTKTPTEQYQESTKPKNKMETPQNLRCVHTGQKLKNLSEWITCKINVQTQIPARWHHGCDGHDVKDANTQIKQHKWSEYCDFASYAYLQELKNLNFSDQFASQ